MTKRVFHVGSIRPPTLGDPGAVSRAERKGATKVFKHERKNPWVPILTGPFPNGQANADSWLGTKYALYYRAQSANSFSWVLFVSSYTTAIVSPHLPGSFTKLAPARETFIFYFPNQKRRNYWWVEKTFRMLSAGAILFAQESQKSNSLAWQNKTKKKTLPFFVHFFAVTARLPRENA